MKYRPCIGQILRIKKEFNPKPKYTTQRGVYNFKTATFPSGCSWDNTPGNNAFLGAEVRVTTVFGDAIGIERLEGSKFWCDYSRVEVDRRMLEEIN